MRDGKWFVTYGDQYLVAGPYDTEVEAHKWLKSQAEDYPDESNDWSNHRVERILDEELPEWEAIEV